MTQTEPEVLPMLCPGCNELPPEVIDERCRMAASRPGWHRLRHVVCESCSRMLPADDPDDRLLDKLSTLARFGLLAGASPILKS